MGFVKIANYLVLEISIRHDNVIDLMMKITGRIIFKTTFRCPHDTIIRSKYNISQITRILMYQVFWPKFTSWSSFLHPQLLRELPYKMIFILTVVMSDRKFRLVWKSVFSRQESILWSPTCHSQGSCERFKTLRNVCKINTFEMRYEKTNLLTGFLDLMIWVSFQAPGSTTKKRGMYLKKSHN